MHQLYSSLLAILGDWSRTENFGFKGLFKGPHFLLGALVVCYRGTRPWVHTRVRRQNSGPKSIKNVSKSHDITSRYGQNLLCVYACIVVCQCLHDFGALRVCASNEVVSVYSEWTHNENLQYVASAVRCASHRSMSHCRTIGRSRRSYDNYDNRTRGKGIFELPEACSSQRRLQQQRKLSKPEGGQHRPIKCRVIRRWRISTGY